jgi:hypothetical protein
MSWKHDISTEFYEDSTRKMDAWKTEAAIGDIIEAYLAEIDYNEAKLIRIQSK